jgi:hypothetical protein
LLLLPPSATVQRLKDEIAMALNDTSDPPREVKADDISVCKQTDGQWRHLDQENKGVKRAREATLEELDIRGVGAGSTADGDGETLAYTVRNGLDSEETIDIEAYPRDD